MKKSSNRRNNKGVTLIVAVLIVLLVILCIGALILAGYDVNTALAVYAITSTTVLVASFCYQQFKSARGKSKNEKANRIIRENENLRRENSKLLKEYEKDYNSLTDEIELLKKRLKIANESTRIYRKTALELEEIQKKIKATYQEMPAIIEAYKAEIMGKQEEARRVYEEIGERIKTYESTGDIEELEKACSIYMDLTKDLRKWLPSKKNIDKLEELVEKNRQEETISTLTANEDIGLSENSGLDKNEGAETIVDFNNGKTMVDSSAAESVSSESATEPMVG